MLTLLTSSNNQGTVSVIALAHVQQAGDLGAGQEAKVLVKDAELATAQGQHHRVLWHELVQAGVVLALGLSTITAAHQEDMLQALIVDGLDHLCSK